MIIAYLVNMYPKISHTFIRREIAALEADGFVVHRFAIRDSGEPLVDEADQAEARRTRVILDAGAWRILTALIGAMMSRPLRFVSGLRLAVRVGRGSDRGLLYHLIYLAEACLLLRWLAGHRVEHLHAHWGTNPAAVAMLCRELGGPSYSFTVHGPTEFDRAAVLGLDEKIGRAAFVAAISDFCRSQLLRWCSSADWPKIRVVRCGLDGRYMSQEPPAIPEARRLVCIGRICEQKGQLILMDAAAVLATRGIDFELVLVGDGEMRPQVEQRIQQHALGDRVRITGWATEQQVQQELAAARALVLPSFAEGLPVVIMEAMAMGRPVLSTYVAGIPELVQPDQTGWLVPAAAVEPLADAMQQVVEMSSDKLNELGKNGRQRTCERHNAVVEAHKLAQVFRESTGVSASES